MVRVLLVEDDATVRQTLARQLTHAGMTVQSAGTGPEALEAYAEQPADVVLDLGRGLALLLAYAVGLVGVLLAVALLGSSLVQRLRWASDPHTPWRRAIGALLVVLGLLIATGAMQDLETWLVDNSPVRPWEWGPA